VSPFDEVAQSQFGLVTRAQGIAMMGNWRFRRAVEEEQLVGIGGGVFRCAGTTSSFRQRAMAACLAYGAPVAISHRSAAALWGYEAVDRGRDIEVSIPPRRSGRRPGLHAYRVAVPDDEVVSRFGIPVTSAARTTSPPTCRRPSSSAASTMRYAVVT
jgi:hypothetical protein